MTYAETEREARRLENEHAAIIASTRRTWPIGNGAVANVYAIDEYGDLHIHIGARTSDSNNSRPMDLGMMNAAQVARYAACLAAIERWKAGEGELPATITEEVAHD